MQSIDMGAVQDARLETFQFVLDGLMRRYQVRVPDVARVLQVMTAAGLIADPSAVENDHIAFRTMGVPNWACLSRADFPALWLHPP